MNKKLAIIGKKESKAYAPYNDLSFDIWGFNVHDMATIPRFTKWFDIHSKNGGRFSHILTEIIPKDKLVLREDLPIDKLRQMVNGNYFNNTVAYLIAYAVYLGYTTIYLYGMTFSADFEQRENQLQNVREMIFFARGKGVNVWSYHDNITKEYKLYK